MGKFYSVLFVIIFGTSLSAQLLLTTNLVFRNANHFFADVHLKAHASSLHICFNRIHYLVKQLSKVEIKGFHSAANRLELFYFPILKLIPPATTIRVRATLGKVAFELRSFRTELVPPPKIKDSYRSIFSSKTLILNVKGLMYNCENQQCHAEN